MLQLEKILKMLYHTFTGSFLSPIQINNFTTLLTVLKFVSFSVSLGGMEILFCHYLIFFVITFCDFLYFLSFVNKPCKICKYNFKRTVNYFVHVFSYTLFTYPFSQCDGTFLKVVTNDCKHQSLKCED